MPVTVNEIWPLSTDAESEVSTVQCKRLIISLFYKWRAHTEILCKERRHGQGSHLVYYVATKADIFTL